MPRRYRLVRSYRPLSTRAEPLKIALVLSGAVALGSFEAGVVFEVLKAIEAGAPLAVDVIVGTSAGALVGAMAAKCLLAGVPFGTMMPRWTEYTLQELTSRYETADQAAARGHPLDRGILSSEAVRQIVEQTLVSDAAAHAFRPAYPAPRTVLTVTATNLDGLPDFIVADGDRRFAESISFRFQAPDPGRSDADPYPPSVWRRVSLACRASSAFPGAFDPEFLPWAERIRFENLVEESWDNDPIYERLDRLDPTIQPNMRYSDGGILDEHPLERAITMFPDVTGGPGEAGDETLVYDPRRCILFVEPDAESTSPASLKAGTDQNWFATFGRAVRLWTLSASPTDSQRRVTSANKRQERLLQFLADLARRMRDEGQAPTVGQAVRDFRRQYPELSTLHRVGMSSGGLGEPAGLIDPGRYKQAVSAFYQWLADAGRFQRDMQWLDRLPPGRMQEMHRSVRLALLELREAYLALSDLDPEDPRRFQQVLEDVHADLADSLGLAQPWVALQQITPEDPKLMLKGEGIAHFGGFFSREYLQHDYDVGRYYAHLWLKEVVPGFVPPQGPPRPPLSSGGMELAVLWQNRGPLWRMAGRFLGAVLEVVGISWEGAGQWMVRLLGWSFLLSAVHGLVLLVGAWFGLVDFPPQYRLLRIWLLGGSSIFPLLLGLFLGMALRADSVRAIRDRFAKRRESAPGAGARASMGPGRRPAAPSPRR